MAQACPGRNKAAPKIGWSLGRVGQRRRIFLKGESCLFN
jgi:hypothetical protein